MAMALKVWASAGKKSRSSCFMPTCSWIAVQARFLLSFCQYATHRYDWAMPLSCTDFLSVMHTACKTLSIPLIRIIQCLPKLVLRCAWLLKYLQSQGRKDEDASRLARNAQPNYIVYFPRHDNCSYVDFLIASCALPLARFARRVTRFGNSIFFAYWNLCVLISRLIYLFLEQCTLRPFSG